MVETIIFSFISLLAGYLIGSISPGYLFGRILKKIDIRQYGIGNTGATNTFRVVGALVAAVTESLPIGVDDNFTVALISGAAMYLMEIL